MFRFLQLAYLRNKESIRRRTKVQSRHCTGGRSRHFVISRLYIHAAVVSGYCHDVRSSEPNTINGSFLPLLTLSLAEALHDLD